MAWGLTCACRLLQFPQSSTEMPPQPDSTHRLPHGSLSFSLRPHCAFTRTPHSFPLPLPYRTPFQSQRATKPDTRLLWHPHLPSASHLMGAHILSTSWLPWAGFFCTVFRLFHQFTRREPADSSAQGPGTHPLQRGWSPGWAPRPQDRVPSAHVRHTLQHSTHLRVGDRKFHGRKGMKYRTI